MFLAGYPIAALGPLGAGAVRDLTGLVRREPVALFGIAAADGGVCSLRSRRARLRPEGA